MPTTLRRPRVLYLAFYFPPSRASGVYRARATANHLAANGWDVTVLTAPQRYLREVIGSVDEALVATVDPRVAVERPSMSYYPWEHDIRRFGRFRATMPVLARKGHRWSQEHLFPEAYSSWAAAAVARGLRLHLRQRFDAVLATGNPFASFGAAWTLRRLTGLPYVLDYRDSWTLNLFTEEDAFAPRSPAWAWQRRVLSSAHAVVFVNEALRQWHAERYPAVAGRMLVVPNGWDPELLEVGEPAPAAPVDEPRSLRFSYVGTLTRNQPVRALVEAFALARRHPELADAELNIYGHLGFSRHSAEPLLALLGLTGDAAGNGVRYRGPVSKVEISRAYESSDVLVFLAGGGRYVTSGKVFEYMAAGRPIVSVHNAGTAAGEVLDGYPLWFDPGGLDIGSVAGAMIAAGKAARDLSAEQIRDARAHAAAFTRERLLAPLERALRQATRDRRGGRRS